MSQNNVVVVTVDSLRADHCGFLSGDDGLTPTLDCLAADGVVFETALAPGPRTPSAMSAAFTGEFLYTEGHGVEEWRGRRRRIADHLARFRTIPERLRGRGYETVGFNTNPWTTVDTGFDTGFDSFEDVGFGEDLSQVTDSSVVRLVDRVLDATDNNHWFRWDNKKYWFAHWPQFYGRIRAALHEASEPYFAWIFLTDSHLPYVVPGRFRVETTAPEMYYSAFRQNRHAGDGDLPDHVVTLLRRAYRDAVRSVDCFVERLCVDVGDADTRFVIHADHGEAFGEHGTFGHQRSFYEENVRVPLLLANTGRAERVPGLVTLRSLPAIVERLTRERGDRSFADLTVGTAATTTENREVHAIRYGDWKYVDDGPALYHLGRDPGERTDIATDRPEVTATLERVAATYRRHQTEQLAIDGAARRLADEEIDG